MTRNGSPSAGADRAAHQDVVREDEVGGQQLPQRGDVRLDVAAALLGGEVLEQPRLEPLVAVEHEHGQQPVGQLGPDDRGARRGRTAPGPRSWQTTVTSCPARLHSRASARV